MKTTDRDSLQWLRLASVTAAVMALLVAGCGDKKKPAGEASVAATVNKEDITAPQIEFVLKQQRGLKPEQVDNASKQILERLIDQELAVQRAGQLKLDREPRILQQIEAARREVLSRAYLEQAGDAAPKPTPEEVAKYYDDQPALFKDRRVYNLQEIAVEARADQIPALRSRLEASKNVADFIEFLKANDFRFNGNQAVRAAEQLPLASLQTFATMKDGQALLNTSPGGAQIIVLAGSRAQPVTLEQARPAIEQYLLNDRKRDLIAKDMKALRDAATIRYQGKFAEPASVPAAAALAAPGAAPAPQAAPAASAGLDPSSIAKGIGLKQ